MAHFAQLDENNKVLQVIVVHNNELFDENNNEIEQKGINFCKELFGKETTWIQTSYNGTIRKNYAGIDFTYDSNLDAFIPPQPFSSWSLNTDTGKWDPPIPYPLDNNNIYFWSEDIKNWTKMI